MTKKEIIRSISEKQGMTQQQAKEMLLKTFDTIIEIIVKDGRIELRNFGVFEVKTRPARQARNPKTGEAVQVNEKCVVTFRPGKVMEEKVRKLLDKKEK